MPVIERYQIDYFAILVLIVAILTLIYVVVTAIYFWNLMNSRTVSTTHATALFWSAVVIGILYVIIGIWAIIRIFTNTVPVYVDPVVPVVVPTVAPVAPAVVAPVSAVTPVVTDGAHTPIQIIATH